MTTGFTAGIAVVIATLQLKDFFGLTVAKMPETYLEKVAVLFREPDDGSVVQARGTASADGGRGHG